ncbi:MAG: family 16 glycosylhydrolase [Anaerolineae bacterium]|nr:family 16 glycosylhydrolase [Anaerolineae bacterium]
MTGSMPEQFRPSGEHWNQYVLGGGALEQTENSLRFVTVDASSERLAEAQIDDYHTLARRRFLWQPPLTLTVRARFSHGESMLRGTAGFGFWNDPFMMTGKRWPTLPRALWFFYASQPSNMKLDVDVAGYGWKAATIDALRLPFFLLAPLAPVAVPLMNVRLLYRALWPAGQRAIGVREATVKTEMTDWHTYSLEWRVRTVLFCVDGTLVLESDRSPRGPLGCVIWLDNQYMVVTPWGRFGYGRLDAPGKQWMDVDRLTIERRA